MARILDENAERRGIERKMRAVGNRQADPARCQNPCELSVRKQSDIAAQRAEMPDQTVRADRDFTRHLSAGAAIDKTIPARALLANFAGKLAFVITVIPLRKVCLDNRRRP